MMQSPKGYIESHKEKTYKELLVERKELLKEIYSFENGEEGELEKRLRKDKDEIVIVNPSPEVRYQCHLSYLAELCELIREKYNKEYVWKNWDI